jgi:hypothetical protein
MSAPGFLHDHHGKPSHHRLLVLLTVPALVLVPLGVWARLQWRAAVPVGIDPSIPLYLTAANGIILAYAGYNKSQEAKAPGPQSPAQP